MSIPQDSVPSLLVISLFVLLMAAVTAFLFVRTWRVRSAIIAEVRNDTIVALRQWRSFRERLRVWRDPEFGRRWRAVRDYEALVGLIDALRARAEIHYVMSEQAVRDSVRDRHAGQRERIEAAIPGIAAKASDGIVGMSDEDIGFVAERLAGIAAENGAPVGPAAFMRFLRSERELLRDAPAMMESHSGRLADFVCLEVESARADSDGDRRRDDGA